MSVVFVLERVRVYDDYPILNVRVGEARYSTPIRGEKNKEKYSKKLTFLQRFPYFKTAKVEQCDELNRFMKQIIHNKCVFIGISGHFDAFRKQKGRLGEPSHRKTEYFRLLQRPSHDKKQTATLTRSRTASAVKVKNLFTSFFYKLTDLFYKLQCGKCRNFTQIKRTCHPLPIQPFLKQTRRPLTICPLRHPGKVGKAQMANLTT